jgi:hypothetical protein
MSKINERLIMNKSTNNKSQITTNWHKHLYNICIYHEYLFFIEASLNVTVLVLHRVKNILVITEPIIATLFDRVLKVRQSKLLRVSVLT